MTDSNGSIANSYEYDAFGRITKSEGSIANRYTYNGEVYDTITEQYYLRARYYNPMLSRFTQEDVYRGDGLNLYAFCGHNPVRYVDPSGYYKASEDLFDSDSAYMKGSSTSLKNDIVSTMSNGTVSTAKLGSHQAQHIIPNEFYNHPAVALSGYQVDHYENGIMAINHGSASPNAMNEFISKNNISDTMVSKYVTNTTQHGVGESSLYHEAYSTYVKSELDSIAKKYGISDCVQSTYSDFSKQLKESGNLAELQSDMKSLNEFLRSKHIDGIDLYLKNVYNTNVKDYMEGGISKEKAQAKYEEENFGKKCKA